MIKNHHKEDPPSPSLVSCTIYPFPKIFHQQHLKAVDIGLKNLLGPHLELVRVRRKKKAEKNEMIK